MIRCLPHTYATRLNGMIDFWPTAHACDHGSVGIAIFTLLFKTRLIFSLVKWGKRTDTTNYIGIYFYAKYW
jgi:hypothetical protein